MIAEFLARLVEGMRRHDEYDKKRIVVLIDNLHAHGTPLIREIARFYDIVLLFNAPYSPELNFVENAFNLIKRKFRVLNIRKVRFIKK